MVWPLHKDRVQIIHTSSEHRRAPWRSWEQIVYILREWLCQVLRASVHAFIPLILLPVLQNFADGETEAVKSLGSKR